MVDNESAVQEIETDDFDKDVRAAIEELGHAPDTKPDIVLDKPSRARDEAGKFVESPKEEKPKRETLSLKEKSAETAPSSGLIADPAQQIGQAPVTVKAPDGLKPELKEKFSTLAPEWQQEFARREADAHKALTKHDEERNFGKKMRETINPYMQTILQEGGTPERAVEELFRTAMVLRSPNPEVRRQALHTIAQQFNVDLRTPLQQGSGNPQIDALMREVGELKGQLQGQTQQRQLQEEYSLRGQIDDFAAQPGHEHFEQVRELMGVLLESGKAADLQDAYDRAVYADPEIRSGLLAAQNRSAEEKRLTELTAKTERAKSAAVSVTGAPGVTRPSQASGSVGSIEDDLRAAMAEVMGRV